MNLFDCQNSSFIAQQVRALNQKRQALVQSRVDESRDLLALQVGRVPGLKNNNNNKKKQYSQLINYF